MKHKTKIKKIKPKILKEIRTIIDSPKFLLWLDEQKLSATHTQFVLINNSFLFRENIKTNKSDKYLALNINSEKRIITSSIFVFQGEKINSDFKIILDKPEYTKTDLETAIANELDELGEVIFTIVGDIQDINEVSEKISTAHFKKLTLCPTLSTLFLVIGDEIKIKDYGDRELIWTEIQNYCAENSIEIHDNLGGIIDAAITNLQDNAFAKLDIPKSFDKSKQYLLDKISTVISTHLTSYNENIHRIDSDPNSMIEILRISYNFVSDVNKLLTLVVTLCDLKPIVLWLTLSKYLNLDSKFQALPWGFAKQKPSLKSYESIIKNARNRSFHQLFPFNKDLRFELDAIEKVSVTIFSSFTKKDGNKMSYKDQQLYDLLRSFTRVNEQIVSKSFWIKNEEVMVAVHDLIGETAIAIKSLR